MTRRGICPSLQSGNRTLLVLRQNRGPLIFWPDAYAVGQKAGRVGADLLVVFKLISVVIPRDFTKTLLTTFFANEGVPFPGAWRGRADDCPMVWAAR